MESECSQRDQILMLLKNITIDTLKDIPVAIYLFGSWARKEEKRTSDIDIGFQSNEKTPAIKWVELRKRIEESPLPYKVDLVDLSEANPVMLEKVKREGILWRDFSRGSNSQTEF